MAGFIYLPVVTDETIYMAERLNEGRISKLVDGKAMTVGADAVILYEDNGGLSSIYITYGGEGYKESARVKVEGLHPNFVNLPVGGKGYSLPNGRIKRVLAKSGHPSVKVELEFGETKDPYTVLASSWTGKRKAIRRFVRKGVLRNLTAADRLYIVAHGYFLPGDEGTDDEVGSGSVAIGAARGATRVQGLKPTWVGGTEKTYSAARLARALKKEGLPKNFKELHLFACGGGLERSDTGRAFAQDLKAALAHDYPRIRVYGYKGDVSPEYINRELPPDDDDQRYSGHKNPTMQGKTATKHKGVTVKGISYPARSQRVEF